MNLENKELIEKAKTCKGCIDWLEVCKAECCKVFKVHTSMIKRGRNRTLTVKMPIDGDAAHYYKLRGCRTTRMSLIIPEGHFSITTEGNFTYFHAPCKALDENDLCTLHGTNNKPKLCNEFNELTGGETNRWYTVPSCLANYRREKNEDNKRENNER